jgi:hypothetical protein
MFEDLIPDLQEFARALLDAAGQAGLQPRVTSTRRTYAAQSRLYKRFLAGQSPYPAAPPGTSAHEFGYAFDMVTSPLDALQDVGYTWETWGGIWGGHFGDEVHFEFPGFVAPSQTPAQILNAAAGLLPGPAGILASVSPTPIFVYDPQRTFNWKDFFDPGHFFH